MANTVKTNWIPNIFQDGNPANCIVSLIDSGGITRTNIFKLDYYTTFTLRPVDVLKLPQQLINNSEYNRPSGIGVVPLLNIETDNPVNPIKWYCIDNSYAVIIKDISTCYVSSQVNSDDTNVRAYNQVAIIRGAYNNDGTYSKDGADIKVKVAIDQLGGQINNTIYERKTVQFYFNVTKTITNISLKSKELLSFPILGNKWTGFPIIQCEYLDVPLILQFSQFATTDRLLLNGDGFDYNNIKYYISKTLNTDGTDILTVRNDYIDISNNHITFLNSTYLFNITTSTTDNIVPQYFTIPIAFYQDEDAVYKKSSIIGDSQFSLLSQRTTIQLRIIRSTPTFAGQTPSINTVNPNTVYLLPNLSKMTNTPPFEILPPKSTNTDNNFEITSNMPNVVTIINDGGKFMAYIYEPGIAIINVYQRPSRNFNAKTANFSIFVNLFSPSIANCNNNIVYTNPYQSQFWTRFKPPCPNYNLTTTIAGVTQTLTPDQVDSVYSMRRKAEILKYTSNVGGLTKSQKYAKASRGELMRQIGNENKYIQNSNNSNSLTCNVPTTRVLCGLTSACGVPGKEQVLCYDPSINVYNLTRTYEYKAGLQTTSNIPTIALTQPRNLVGTLLDGSNNKIYLTWDSPISNGGLPITSYIITYSNDNKNWKPYKSLFPNGGSVDTSTGEKNGNYSIFEPIEGIITIDNNQIYYISVFSANERGLSSIPSIISKKTSSAPSIISNLSIYGDDRLSTEVKIKWTDPLSSISSTGQGYNGPPITGYKIRYKNSIDNVWITKTITSGEVNTVTNGGNLDKWYSLNSLVNKTTYSIIISPINSVGTGPESRILSARTLMSPSPPYDIVLTGRYGIPPNQSSSTQSTNYIIVSWKIPNNGGSPITSYNITVSDNTLNQTYTVDATNVSFILSNLNSNYNIVYVENKPYNITMTSYNADFERSKESISQVITLLPNTVTPIIREITPYYDTLKTSVEKIKLTFFIGIFNALDSPIVEIKVSGLGVSNDESIIITEIKNTEGKLISGSGLHSIYVQSTNNSLIQLNSSYSIILNLKFGGITNEYTNPSLPFKTITFDGKI